ncbi:hypothetical protein ACFQI7_07935 [Paenibacillus allorhizosphaerae]|uniref:Tat pathway signal sequence domain protein n=1 Tax=Paenibacillus allorhizosphaerae TaxID=2849866 RepID=A0ABN7TP20_9BACL|nr:hypothetical protein [Paenibacillus allorhizosphaerae]CAG7638081.1 hypothetical protein PAECIP111802_02404 [Paenibacillus allorhizosphaerae]
MNNNISVNVHRLGSQTIKPAESGVTWGIPWKKGALLREENLTMTGPSGTQVPLQSWPTAYWPDGSVKWSAHAAALGASESDAVSFVVSKGKPAVPAAPIHVREENEYIEVSTGAIMCQVNKAGADIVRAMYRGETLACSGGKLVCIREEQRSEAGGRVYKEQDFVSHITKAAVEQSGPVRAVIKVEGRHKAVAGSRAWLPFSLRLYFFAGLGQIRIVHSFVYDGNPHQDAIKGLGIAFSLPMSGPLHNRHVRLGGDTGFFAESPKHLMTFRTKGKYEELFRRQTAGEAISFDPQEDAAFIGLLEDAAVWDDFKLVQSAPDYYEISKRTQEVCCWLKSGSGNRSAGVVFAGSESGGMSATVRNFWRKCPSALELRHMSTDTAEMIVWFWSPDAARAMDLRHYDTKTHLLSAYEGFDEMRSTPYGIANTNELTLHCFESTPTAERLKALAEEADAPSLLVCEPQYYYDVKAFGIWSLPDRSTAMKAQLEDRLDAVIDFYKTEVEQRKWYGFWDYGDFMHSYDPTRHVWRYDVGGCAWQNTELAPNMWLWYMFLRSGREDIFRLAEAMTRHTSEVDVYHIGEYAGLGTRHNVIHWGCGCKEARIAMAGLHRYYYYLTADERIGDIMNEVADSDYTTVHLDPMRSYYPKDEFPTHIRVGPDWAAFSSNWMTRWERYEDTQYRDKLLIGIADIKGMPFRLRSGPVYGYDPKSGRLTHFGDDNWGRHLAVCMGGPQVWFELAELLEDPEWEEMMAEFGLFYLLSKEQKAERTGGAIAKWSWDHPVLASGIIAYGASRGNDKELARKVWDILLNEPFMARIGQPDSVDGLHYVRPVQEIDIASTNIASQWSLNTILSLELLADSLPEG